MRLVKNRSIDPLSIAIFFFFFGIFGIFGKMGRSVEDEEETKDSGIVAAAAAATEGGGGGGGGGEARLLRITSIRREEEVADEEFVENLKRQNDDDDDDDSRSNIISTSTGSSRCSSPREKEKKEEGCRLWSKVKYQLVKFEALPEHLRDNEYIRGHYRLNWPLGPTLLSLFSFHNETLNIWTHFLGFLLFLGLTILTVRKLPTYVEPCLEQLLQMPSYLHLPEEFASCLIQVAFPELTQKIVHCNVTALYLQKKHITRWPFFVFLGGAMFCLLSSTTCHLFSCISPHCSYLLLRLDYTGIALLIAGSFYPPVYYSFACNPFLRDMYLTTITIIGIGTVLASLLPVFETTKYRTFRACLFFGMGISGVIPCIHKLFLYQDIEPILYQTLFMEIAMGIFYGLGALVYATRIPERWKPGMFDILGNSHQLFHLLVIAGAYTHYESGLLYLKWRDVKGCGT